MDLIRYIRRRISNSTTVPDQGRGPMLLPDAINLGRVSLAAVTPKCQSFESPQNHGQQAGIPSSSGRSYMHCAYEDFFSHRTGIIFPVNLPMCAKTSPPVCTCINKHFCLGLVAVVVRLGGSLKLTIFGGWMAGGSIYIVGHRTVPYWYPRIQVLHSSHSTRSTSICTWTPGRITQVPSPPAL